MSTAELKDRYPEDWPADWSKAAEAGVCLHCGNDLGRFWKVEDGPFCCRGCKGVYEMIHQEDLCRFYDLKPGATAPAALLRPESFDWLDRMLAEREETGAAADEPLHLDLDIQGVHCAACVWLIEELFQRRAGGVQLRINPTLGTVELAWNPAGGDLKEFLSEIEKFGYRLGPARKTGARLVYGVAVTEGHRVRASLRPLPDGAEAGLRAAVAELERDVRAHPWHWWQWNILDLVWQR